MDREQMQEWFEFQKLAHALVKKGNVIELKRGIATKRLVQIVKFPSFSSTVGWELFHQREAKLGIEKYFAVRKEWLFSEDSKKFENPIARLAHPKAISPTIITKTIELNSSIGEQIIQKLEPISIPALFPATSDGLDGTSWQFTSGDSWAGLCLSWWEHLPGNLKSISDKIQTVFQVLEKIVATDAS
jgi:hypothetical protein